MRVGEVVGRDTGWIALFAGIAGTADVILIPEIPYRLDIVCEKINDRYEGDIGFAIVVVAEGAFPEGGDTVLAEKGATGKTERLGGIADRLALEIGERTGRETRSLALRHLQRGGQPNAYDRPLALRFGAAAVKLVQDGCVGCMVALHPPEVLAVPLAEAVAEIKRVPLGGDVVRTARSIGISFGD